MKYTQLFLPASLSLRGEQRHREVNNVPRDTQVVSHRADLNPNWRPLQWWVNTQPRFANCCGSSEVETRHFSWSPLPAKMPHPLPILRAGWGRRRGGGKWRRSWLFWPKPCKICRAEMPRAAISDQKALKAFISSNWGSRIQRWQNDDEWLIYMPWTNNRESVNLGPSTLKRKMDSQMKRIIVKQWRNNNNQHLTVPQAFKACLYIS